jgi:hypothetical protein
MGGVECPLAVVVGSSCDSAQGVAVLLQLVHDIIGNQEALIFAQLVTQAAHQLARPHERKGNVASGAHENRMRTRRQKVK